MAESLVSVLISPKTRRVVVSYPQMRTLKFWPDQVGSIIRTVSKL